MKKYTPAQLIHLLLSPILTVLMGLVLLFSPDTAAAFMSKLLGWLVLLGALTQGLSARSGSKKSASWAAILTIIGLWLLVRPLSLTKILGRLLGLAFFAWGVGTVRRNFRGKLTPGLVAAGAVAILGTVLFLVPMSATRLVLNIAGIVIIGIGVADGFDRIQGRKLLAEGSDPNIIDVEKL